MQASATGIAKTRTASQGAFVDLTATHFADIDRALERARDTHAPCLLRSEFTLKEHDLVSRYAALALGREMPFIFKRPRGELTIVAWGAIEMAHGSGCSRFASAVEHCSRVRELEMVGTSKQTPLWVGGAAFAPRRPEPFASRATSDAWAGWPDARFWIPRVMLLADHDGARAVISTWVRPADDRDAIIVGLSSELSGLPRTTPTRQGQSQSMTPSVGRAAWVSLESEESWGSRVEAACELISRGGLDKIVLARAIRMKAPRGSHIDVARTLQTLTEQHTASTCFVVGNDDGSFFLGATPETLLAVRDGWLETHALAGTAPRGATHREDEALAQALIASAKNREEHDVVAQALRERLAARCTMLETSAHEPRLVKLARVQHLETILRGKLTIESHVVSLAAELHPTPAVGGFPGTQAVHYLAESEPLERGWYSGPLGVVDGRGDGVLVVGIRSLMVRGDTAWAFAGGGIVAASNARDEWRETELKLVGITDAVSIESSDFEARPDDRPQACAP